MTTVPDTLSPGVKVLDGLLSFISKTVDDIVTLRENINEMFMTPVSCLRMAVQWWAFLLPQRKCDIKADYVNLLVMLCYNLFLEI